MMIFKKDGMLAKLAEEKVRKDYRYRQTGNWETPVAVGEMFTVNFHYWIGMARYGVGDVKFRVMSDGSIQSPVYDFTKKNDKGGYSGKWTLCAIPPKPPEGEPT